MSDSISPDSHQFFMRRCLQLAANGLGKTYPNPLVGCVIVKNGSIIGEGWHKKAGGPHAEVVAINGVEDKNLLENATLYVNLEPCCHHGKTPPCTDLIILHGIKKVLIGSLDPNPKVAGKGVKQLEAAGCEVAHGILKKEALWLNRRFFTTHTLKRPYIILKWAQSADGFISPQQRDAQKPVWITGTQSRQMVHKWRSEEQGILVGINTVLADDPNLTTRLLKGASPHRFLIDPKGKVFREAAILNAAAPTTVISNTPKPKAIQNAAVEWIEVNDSMIEQVLKVAYSKGLQSIIIEGGAYTLQQFIDKSLWDEARIFTGEVTFKKGVAAPTIEGDIRESYLIESDRYDIVVPKPR